MKRLFALLTILEIAVVILGSVAYSHQTKDMTSQIMELQQERDTALHELNATTNQLMQANADYNKLQDELNREKQARLKSEKALKDAEDKLKKTTAPKTSLKPVKVIANAQVTWYNDSGITASGAHTEMGRTIAVDPSVIPMGSWVRLTFPDGHSIIRHAEDTGGAVHGAVIDVYSDAPTSALLDRGRTRGVVVTILRKS